MLSLLSPVHTFALAPWIIHAIETTIDNKTAANISVVIVLVDADVYFWILIAALPSNNNRKNHAYLVCINIHTNLRAMVIKKA